MHVNDTGISYVLYLQDVELQDLRDTIDILKSKNTEAQVIIQGALNAPESTPKGLDLLIQTLKMIRPEANQFDCTVSRYQKQRPHSLPFHCFCLSPELQINRQNSSESIASMNSITSHSSLGSLKEQDAKKKKKKSWVR